MTTADENDVDQMAKPIHQAQSPAVTIADMKSNIDTNENSRLKKEWKLEDSSLWWLSHDIFQHPGNVLLMASIPFCAGAYVGYTKPMENMEKLIGPTTTTTTSTAASTASTNSLERQFGSEAERRAMGFRVASRALRIATLSSVGTFGMIGAGKSSLVALSTARPKNFCVWDSNSVF